MAHIKCKYQIPYCGTKDRLNYFQKPCDPNVGYTYPCDTAYYDMSYGCEHRIFVDAEFEKDAKNYEVVLEEVDPVLKVGRNYYSDITYLEIDGRILIGGDENA